MYDINNVFKKKYGFCFISLVLLSKCVYFVLTFVCGVLWTKRRRKKKLKYMKKKIKQRERDRDTKYKIR